LEENSIIHIRGEVYSFFVRNAIKRLKIKNIKIISDIRGANPEEIKVYLKQVYNPIKYWIKLSNSYRALTKMAESSDHISCVSTKLKEYVLSLTDFQGPISVNHCIASRSFFFDALKRREYREILGLNPEDIVCIFMTGGNGPYQNTSIAVSGLLNKGIKVLNLSRMIIPGAINKYVSFDEIPGYLCAADVGIIWRNNDIVNNVASPVKFSEYVCCGLPVIANMGVQMINDYISLTGFGLSISGFDEIDSYNIQILLDMDRNKISEFGINNYSSTRIIMNYFQIYESLLKN